MKGRLTSRQKVFADAYALHGGARQAAILAGVNPRSAHTRAHRWLKLPAVKKRVELLRAAIFANIRERIESALLQGVQEGLANGVSCLQAQRCLRLLHKLGIFPHDPFAPDAEQPAETDPQRETEEQERRHLLETYRAEHQNQPA